MEPSESGVMVFPNPTSDLVSIDFNGRTPQGDIKLYDMTGKMVRNYNIVSGRIIKLDLVDLDAGNYVLSIESDIINEKRLIAKQ